MIKGTLAVLLAAVGAVLPSGDGALSVWNDGKWVEWFDGAHPPERWEAPLPVVADAVTWVPGAPGIEIGRLRLSGPGEAWRIGVVLVRIDPAAVRWRLTWGMRDAIAKEWTIEKADSTALVAVNAGMFVGSGPFGWTVIDGVERKVYGSGALAPAFVVDSTGNASLVPAESLYSRTRAGNVAMAFQSYPELLRGDGEVPVMIRPATAAIDLVHRDARLAIGQLRDGKWLIALTRFEGAGGALSYLPFGLTVPEMSALMGALGCARAVSLDGGVSAQLAARNADHTTTRWRGLRKVALGLEILPR
jgi:hypothetical protein